MVPGGNPNDLRNPRGDQDKSPRLTGNLSPVTPDDRQGLYGNLPGAERLEHSRSYHAPAPATINPRSGPISNGNMDYSLMSVAATQMARYYGLPAESAPGGTDSQGLDFQNGYENASMKLASFLAWPDIIVGPGMLDGSWRN